MITSAKRLDEIDQSFLQSLCDENIPETRHLEFKRELPGAKDKDRFEFAKDVSAFANSEGGDIIYGIEENGGTAQRLVPILGHSCDATILRLAQILDANVEPRIDRVEMQCVALGEGFVLVVRVPPLNYGPFRVLQNNSSRFMVRDVSYVRNMTYAEIRSAFSSERNFRAKVAEEQGRAISTISEGATWRPLLAGPAFAFQIVPFAITEDRFRFDPVSSFSGEHFLMLPSWGGSSSALNLDGMIFYTGPTDELYAYSVVRRSGVFECFSFSGHSFSKEAIVPALSLAIDVREAAQVFVKHMTRVGISGPAALVLSLVGMEGRKLEMGSRYFRSSPIGDRNIMAIPPIYVENVSAEHLIDPALKSLMDLTWQAFGVHSCPYYGEAGDWLNPR